MASPDQMHEACHSQSRSNNDSESSSRGFHLKMYPQESFLDSGSGTAAFNYLGQDIQPSSSIALDKLRRQPKRGKFSASRKPFFTSKITTADILSNLPKLKVNS